MRARHSIVKYVSKTISAGVGSRDKQSANGSSGSDLTSSHHEKPQAKHHFSLVGNSDDWQKLKKWEDEVDKENFGK